MKSVKKTRQINIKEIAIIAGTSKATVSNVINQTGRFSSQTADRVKKITAEMGYRPSFIARALTVKKTNIIGVVVPEIDSQYIFQVISGMEDIANINNYTLIISNTAYNYNKEEKEVDKLFRSLVDGIIFISGGGKFEHVINKNLNNLPIVLVDREVKDFELPSVLVNNEKSMSSAVNYLFSKGHKEIGYIGIIKDEYEMIPRKRYSGYKLGLYESGLDFKENNVVILDSMQYANLKNAYELMLEWDFKKKFIKIPTAIITQNDILAIALIKVLKIRGYRIPGDISVMGFDNIYFTNFIEPPLTSVKQPKKELGNKGIKILIDIINGKLPELDKVYLPSEIVEKESVKEI